MLGKHLQLSYILNLPSFTLRQSLSCPGCPSTQSVAQADLEDVVFLSQSPKQLSLKS